MFQKVAKTIKFDGFIAKYIILKLFDQKNSIKKIQNRKKINKILC